MDVPVIRQSFGHLGTEKHQMLELNKRLESYLTRVKFLEEENELLKEEIQALRKNSNPQAWKAELESELRRARDEVEAAWRNKDRVELEVGNLGEELQALGLQRQREAAAQAEARKSLVESKKELEEEKRAQIWLQEKVTQLEKELQFQLEIHQEDISLLKSRLSHARPTPMIPAHSEVFSIQDLSHDYSQWAARAWQEAAAAYQDQVSRLEESLAQARAQMAQVTQDKRDGLLRVQNLSKELEMARDRKNVLEKNVAQQKDRERKQLEQLQAHLESLEGEKADLGDQIADILEDRRNLLQLKMSLGLEVATYRALLDNESLRGKKLSTGSPWGYCTFDGRTSPQDIKQSLQTRLPISHMSSPVSVQIGARTQTTPAMPMTPLQTPKWDTSENKVKSADFKKEKKVDWKVELSTPTDCSDTYPKGLLNGKDTTEHFRAEEVKEEVSHAAVLSELGNLMDKCDNDQPTMGDTEDSAEKMDQHTAKPGKKTDKKDTEPTVEQGTTSFDMDEYIPSECSIFPAEAEELTSPNVTQNISEAANSLNLNTAEGPRGFTEHCVDVGGESSGMTADSQPAPVSAWSEREGGEVVKEREENEWAEGKTPELESRSGSNINERGHALECGTTAEFSNADEPVGPEFESSMSLEATNEVLNHEDEANEGQECISRLEDKDEEDLSDAHEPEELLEDEVVAEEDKLNAWDGKNECTTEHDFMEEMEEAPHDNEVEEREMEEGVGEEMAASNSESDKEVISTNKDPFEERQRSPGDVEQQQISSDGEQVDLSDEDGDDSQNASHSWRTEGGELESNDSYTLENTLADTRPLIRYKSDEADMNTQASHLEDSGSSEDEDYIDREAESGIGGEEKGGVMMSKSADDIENMDREPEGGAVHNDDTGECYEGEQMDAGEDINLEDSEADECQQNMEKDMVPLGDEDMHMKGSTGSKIDLEPAEERLEERDECKNDSHNDLEQERDLKSLESNDGFKAETVDSEAALGLQTDCCESEGEEIEMTQDCPFNTNRDISSQSQSNIEEEGKIRSDPENVAEIFLSSSSVVSESCDQSLSSGNTEISSIRIMTDEGSTMAVNTEQMEVVADKKEDEGQNLSMLTNVDFTDELSLHSEMSSTMGSLANAANSDLDDSYSSEDDSPNASQFSQPIKQDTNQDDLLTVMTDGKLYETMPKTVGNSSEESDLLLRDAMKDVTDSRTESDMFLQNQQEAVERCDTNTQGSDSFAQSFTNLAEYSQTFSYNEGRISTECAAEEESGDAGQPSGDSPNIAQDGVNAVNINESKAVPQTNGKCTDLHNFLSSSLDEHTWNSTKKTGAAYDPRECEQYDHLTTNTSQNVAFGVTWEETDKLLGATEHTEAVMETTKCHSLEDQGQIPVQVKQLLCGKLEEDDIHSEDSLEEGDSWSSGEE